jgi:hypothetical protein
MGALASGNSAAQTAAEAAESTQLGGVLSMMKSWVLEAVDYRTGAVAPGSAMLKECVQVILAAPGVVLAQFDQCLHEAGLEHQVAGQ